MNTCFAYFEIILFGIKIVSKNKRVHSHLKCSIENPFFFFQQTMTVYELYFKKNPELTDKKVEQT